MDGPAHPQAAHAPVHEPQQLVHRGCPRGHRHHHQGVCAHAGRGHAPDVSHGRQSEHAVQRQGAAPSGADPQHGPLGHQVVPPHGHRLGRGGLQHQRHRAVGAQGRPPGEYRRHGRRLRRRGGPGQRCAPGEQQAQPHRGGAWGRYGGNVQLGAAGPEAVRLEHQAVEPTALHSCDRTRGGVAVLPAEGHQRLRERRPRRRV
mmetsp:Transcript_47295/g.151546  ORF Transcript_47295/g.151546 Transcript_47295/m.151546 type:complete len:202 (+) Transcript_47295:1114-1719(+)